MTIADTVRPSIEAGLLQGPNYHGVPMVDGAVINGDSVWASVNANDAGGLAIVTTNLRDGNGNLIRSIASRPTDGPTWFSHGASFTGLPDGRYSIAMNARDLAGNTSNTVVMHFTIDNMAPWFEVKADSVEAEFVEGGFHRLSLSLRDNVGVAAVRVNEGAWMPRTPNRYSDLNWQNMTGLVFGTNVITLRDVAGNESEFVFEWVDIDGVMPEFDPELMGMMPTVPTQPDGGNGNGNNGNGNGNNGNGNGSGSNNGGTNNGNGQNGGNNGGTNNGGSNNGIGNGNQGGNNGGTNNGSRIVPISQFTVASPLLMRGAKGSGW
jgi:hypothetical protein